MIEDNEFIKKLGEHIKAVQLKIKKKERLMCVDANIAVGQLRLKFSDFEDYERDIHKLLNDPLFETNWNRPLYDLIYELYCVVKYGRVVPDFSETLKYINKLTEVKND